MFSRQEVDLANKRCKSLPLQESLERIRPARSVSPLREAGSNQVASTDLRVMLERWKEPGNGRRSTAKKIRGFLGERSLLEAHTV